MSITVIPTIISKCDQYLLSGVNAVSENIDSNVPFNAIAVIMSIINKLEKNIAERNLFNGRQVINKFITPAKVRT